MWLSRQLAALQGADRPVALIGGEAAGVPFVIDALRERDRLAWFRLDASSEGDPVAQGNALASAVDDVVGGAVLATALPYRAHLQTLRHHRRDLLPLTIAVTATAAAHGPFVMALLDLQHDGYRVLVDARDEELPAMLAARCVVMGEAELRVTASEARATLPAGLDDAQVTDALLSSGGRFGTLISLAHRAAGLPRLLVPDAAGARVAADDAASVAPTELLAALRRVGDHRRALELAVLRVPEAVDEVLREAGPRFQEDGVLARLHVLLSALPDEHARTERVLEWRLVAALAAGDLAAVVADVDDHLATHAAPQLRARRAGTLPGARGFAEAEVALRAKRTPLTLWQYGRLHPDHDAALRLLRESVQLADDVGTRYEVVRNAGAYAAKLLHVGAFERAAAWARWALDAFDQAQLRDGTRRLLLVNDLAVARIMCGDLVGVRAALEGAHVTVEGSMPGLAALVRSTLGYLELAEGNPDAAVALFEVSHQASPRRTRARYAYQLVRALAEVGETERAALVAAAAAEVVADGEPFERREGALARGIAGALLGRAGAADDLIDTVVARDAVMEQRLSAALYYLLATGGAAHNLPSDVVDALRALHPSALRVLSGPIDAFEGLWATLKGGAATLTLAFLGGARCRLDGAPVVVPPRLAEAALALTLYPDGVSREQLNDFLTPEGQPAFSPGGMRGMVTRLRSLLPVSEAPYRFTVPYACDVVELRAHLAAGRVREAVALMRGPVLPDSEAPGVQAVRSELEEELRQAALQARDPDVLFDLAERLRDDLECWSSAAAALAAGDPRLALARARVRRLEREYGVA